MKLSRSSLGAILTIKKTGRGKTAMYCMTVPPEYGDTTICYNSYQAILQSRTGFLNKYAPLEK